MLDQERARIDHPLAAVVQAGFGIGCQIRAADLCVSLGNRFFRWSVIDDHPTIAFEVATHRCVIRDLDALEQVLVRDSSGEV